MRARRRGWPSPALGIAALGLMSLLAPLPGQAAGRQVAVVIDTSGSMDGSDPQRYTVQLTQILGDLLEPDDELTAIRMPDGGSCLDQASSALALRLDPRQRGLFKQRLDQVITYGGGTVFAAPIRTAIRALEGSVERQRLLLVIADSGGMGSCEPILTRGLQRLRRSGALIAAINLGGRGAFDSNPAFEMARGARDARQLVEAVAEVYQRFLGAKKVQTGSVRGSQIEVEIAAHVADAYLVVAADGPMGAVVPDAGRPGAADLDTDFRGGGQTLGLDRVTRGYRIVRLRRPEAGVWRFMVSGTQARAGWMLIQDFSRIGVRLVSSPEVIEGRPSLLEVELYDEETGQRITDLGSHPELRMGLELDGIRHELVDDGTNGDQRAGDGVLSATVELEGEGERQLEIDVESQLLDLDLSVMTRVVSVKLESRVTSPSTVTLDGPVELSVEAAPTLEGRAVRLPERYDVATGEQTVELHPRDAREQSAEPAATSYAGEWVPPEPGSYQLDYVPVGGDPALAARAPIEVLGVLDLGRAEPLRLGTVSGGEVVEARLELPRARARGSYELLLSTDLDQPRCRLAVDAGGHAGWLALGSEPVPVRITDSDGLGWPIRLEVGRCPAGCEPGEAGSIRVAGTAANGVPVEVEARLELTIRPEPWLRCWWPWLAMAAGLVLTGVLVQGLWSPSRFQRRLGVVLSPEPDGDEGIFMLIRRVRGSGAGFYRDARVFVCDDYRLSARQASAVARLRAHRKQVRLSPTQGSGLWRRAADDQWEPVPAAETVMRTGVTYRNELGTLYFELRRG